ncbi:hypothetical protein BDZ91DRAFT_751431 [Kalaharituber pfeilii]|nr:hypothetical protein BDZ91DRAFT_751431 [Kalaharituber pfeilii]
MSLILIVSSLESKCMYIPSCPWSLFRWGTLPLPTRPMLTSLSLCSSFSESWCHICQALPHNITSIIRGDFPFTT